MSIPASLWEQLPSEFPAQLERLDRFWQNYRTLSSPSTSVVQALLQERLGDLDCAVVICGGTLGILIGCALQQRGWPVVLLEQGQLQGRAQEWNISRQELQAFCELGLLSEDELASVIVTEYNPARVGFHGGVELWVRDILNIGVDPIQLLALLKTKFVTAGGRLQEYTAFDQVTVYADGVNLQGHLTNTSKTPVQIKARLLLDVMGHFSPIAQQARLVTQGNLPPDGVCLVVGSCAQGLPNHPFGDLIYTFAPIQNQCQYFWEAFPAREGRTTYMFTYADADPQRPSFRQLVADYLAALPAYQEVDLAAVKFQRMLMGFFPAYRQAPLQTPWERILQVGDSSGMQSPLSFGGFGAIVRHLPRLTTGLDEALSHDFLSQGDLRALQPYQPNLSVTWLFQKSMSVGVNQSVEADQINRLLSVTFKAMEKLGPQVLHPFLQDIVQFPALSQTMLAMAVTDPLLVMQIVQQVGAGAVLDWLGHYANLGRYSVCDRLSTILQPTFPNLLPEQRFYWQRWQEAWRFGSGRDHDES